jgi:hypothetical protein
MSPRVVQFAAIIFTALALVPGGAHSLELASKIRFDRESYLAVQVVYRGWAFLGIILIAAVLLNLVVTVLVRCQRSAMLAAATATILLGLSLTIFFVWTFPVNQATSNWSTAPANWQVLRAQWEYSHAVNAGVTFLALCASTLSGLIWRH